MHEGGVFEAMKKKEQVVEEIYYTSKSDFHQFTERKNKQLYLYNDRLQN